MTTLLSYFGTIVGGGQFDPHNLADTIRNCTNLTEFAADPKFEVWVQRAVARLSIFDLDATKEGFEINMIFAVQKMAETFWHEFREETIAQANSPFRSVKLGSHSYTRFDPRGISSSAEEREELPTLVQLLIEAYISEYKDGFSTTRIWQEYDIDMDNIREYHDFLDERLGNSVLAAEYSVYARG